MHDEVTGSSKPRRGGKVVGVCKTLAALIITPVAFVVIVVAAVTVVLWLMLGSTLWVFGAAAGIAKDGGGRRRTRARTCGLERR